MAWIEPDDPGRALTGWVALGGAAMALTCTLSYLAVVGADVDAMSRPAFALGLSPSGLALFRLSQVADCLGYYLPFVAIAAYLGGRLRPTNGAAAIVAPFAFVSATLGVAGSGLQVAALPALIGAHATGDAAVQRGAESAWLAVVEGSQNGLWLMEGPSLGFWGVVTGILLWRKGARLGLFLCVIGAAYLAYAGLSLIGAHRFAQALELAILPAQVSWEALFGVSLLRAGTRS